MNGNINLGGLFRNQNRPKSDRVSVRCETRFPILIQRKAGNFLASYPHLEIWDRPPSEECFSLSIESSSIGKSFHSSVPHNPMGGPARPLFRDDSLSLDSLSILLGQALPVS